MEVVVLTITLSIPDGMDRDRVYADAVDMRERFKREIEFEEYNWINSEICIQEVIE